MTDVPRSHKSEAGKPSEASDMLRNKFYSTPNVNRKNDRVEGEKDRLSKYVWPGIQGDMRRERKAFQDYTVFESGIDKRGGRATFESPREAFESHKENVNRSRNKGDIDNLGQIVWPGIQGAMRKERKAFQDYAARNPEAKD